MSQCTQSRKCKHRFMGRWTRKHHRDQRSFMCLSVFLFIWNVNCIYCTCMLGNMSTDSTDSPIQNNCFLKCTWEAVVESQTQIVSEHIFDLPSKLFPIIQHKYFNTTQIYITTEIMWKIWATNGVLIVHKPFTEVTRPVSLVENITFPCSWEATVRIPRRP